MKRAIILSAVFVASATTMMAQQTETIRMNQVALYPSQQKTAVIEAPAAKKISVTNVATGKAAGKARAVRKSTSPWSGKQRTIVDITNITAPGTYELSANGAKQRRSMFCARLSFSSSKSRKYGRPPNTMWHSASCP
jgi:hypothetical protein